MKVSPFFSLFSFLSTSLLEGGGGSGGDDGMSPKQIKKLSLAAEFHVAITLKCFFTQIFTQILLASIVEGKEIYFL